MTWLETVPQPDRAREVEDPEAFTRLVELLLEQGANVAVVPHEATVKEPERPAHPGPASGCAPTAGKWDVQVVLRPRLQGLGCIALAVCWVWLPERYACRAVELIGRPRSAGP